MLGKGSKHFEALHTGIAVEDRFPLVVEQRHAVLGGDVFPGIGGPEAAAGHQAHAGNAWLRLVEFGREAQHFVIGRNGVDAVDLVDADLLEDRRAYMHLLDVAVERNAEDTFVAPTAIVGLIGFIPVIKGQLPLGDIFVQRLQEALRGEVTEPWREELDGVEAGIAGQEFGHDLVIHGIVRDRHDVDLDAGKVSERLGLLLGRFTVSRAHRETHRLAGVLLADRFPVRSADPVDLGIPQLVVVTELVLVAVFLLDEFADVERCQHVSGIRQVLRIGAAHVEQRDAACAGCECRTGSGRGLEQGPAA